MCLIASSEEYMNVIMEKVNKCVLEYGLNEKKSKVVCIKGEVARRGLKMVNVI